VTTVRQGGLREQPTASSVQVIDGQGFDITFHGVRGSTPCHGDDIVKYGGNTSCVSVDIPGHPSILFDMGTGAQYFGLGPAPETPAHVVCLLSHLHWDHIQGLPFFPPLLRTGTRVELHAPVQGDGDVGTVVSRMLCPPLFPVGLDAYAGSVDFHSHGDDDFVIGDVQVTSRLIPHIGNTLGYRLAWGGGQMAYLSDHQQPGVDVYAATANALELCRGVDVLVHDAQYTRDEFVRKSNWGHCTIDYAMWLAQECGVRTLVLFHHDPSHDDEQLDRLVDAAKEGVDGVRVIGAREGLILRVAP
jgi:phosphoribosyl 1,2-cyclic phosphodiesterase